MPIVRSYMCQTCGHYLNVTLSAEQWNDPAPECPVCAKAQMAQDFKPPGIAGHSARSKAEKLTENILANDYHVGNIHRDRHEGAVPRTSYQTAQWGVAREALESAISAGRQTRLKHGSGLDILQQNLKSGAEPDLIEVSKRRAMRIY